MKNTEHMNLRPIEDVVHVRIEEPEKRTESGLHLVERHETDTRTGVVLATGPECRDVIASDRVLISANHFQKIMIGGKEVAVLREPDILGVIENV